MARRVVVTGLGMVSPLGMGVDHNWREITAGSNGLRSISYFDASDMAARVAGEVPHDQGEPDPARAAARLKNGIFNPQDYVPAKDMKKMGRFIVYAMAAAHEAVADSGWTAETEEAQDRTGVMIGSGIGGLEEIYETSRLMEAKGPRRVSPFFIPSALINLASGCVSIRHGFRGPNHAVVTACSSGAHAIGDAARLIMMNDADVMLAGGAESAINRLGIAGFIAARALSTGYNDTPERASRPFDTGRDGFVMGEGSGILVLEEYEHAKARGAKIYAEVTGYGLSGDAYHITAPAEDGNGGYRAMQGALKHAGLNPEDIEYVNAHGTSTPAGDGIEAGAVKRLFGPAAEKISMSSTKSAIGHLLGAAGAVEAVYSIKAIETGILPPTRNLDNISEGCEGLDLVPHKAKERKIRHALSNSFGFGGTNASLIFSAL